MNVQQMSGICTHVYFCSVSCVFCVFFCAFFCVRGSAEGRRMTGYLPLMSAGASGYPSKAVRYGSRYQIGAAAFFARIRGFR